MLDKYDTSNKQFHFYSIVEYKNSHKVVYVKNAPEIIQYIPLNFILRKLGRII